MGLGIEVTKDVSGVRVISPIDDTPAARAGIRAGDIITKLDGEATADLTLEEAVKRMRGEPKTKIRLEIARKGEMKPLSFTIERATIKTQSVRMKELADGFGYIRISQFQERTAEDLAANINKLEKSGHLKGLILGRPASGGDRRFRRIFAGKKRCCIDQGTYTSVRLCF